MSHNQNLFNKVAEITGHSLLQDEMAEIFEAIRKDEQPSPALQDAVKEIDMRAKINSFYEWLDTITETEYDNLSLTEKCEKFFFPPTSPTA